MRVSVSLAALLVAVAVVAGCGPKKGPDNGGGGGGGGANGSGDGGSANGGGGGGSGGGTAAPAPLTRADCEKMIDHVLEIGMAEQRKNKPAEYVPTEAQVADIRAKMVAQQMDECLAWPRPVWECTIAAPTIEALYKCAEGEPADASAER
jgi:hypothetical protein